MEPQNIDWDIWIGSDESENNEAPHFLEVLLAVEADPLPLSQEASLPLLEDSVSTFRS